MPCHLDLSLFIIICARYIVMRFLFALIVRLALFDFWYRSGSLNYSIQPNQFAPGANLRLLDNEIEFYRKLIHTSKKKRVQRYFLSQCSSGGRQHLTFEFCSLISQSLTNFMHPVSCLMISLRSTYTLEVLSSTSHTKSSQKS